MLNSKVNITLNADFLVSFTITLAINRLVHLLTRQGYTAGRCDD